jgi:hypothetical protein
MHPGKAAPTAALQHSGPEDRPAQPGGPALQRVAVGLAWLKTGGVVVTALFFLLASGGQDPAGRAMAGGLVAIAAVYWLACVFPGLTLARKGRLGLAFAFLLVPDALLLLAVNFL